MSPRERRLVFGEIAELYDAARPTYPGALIDDLASWARSAARARGAGEALEIGAGTGKATRLLAAAGVSVTAIEPSAEMAAIIRRSTAAMAGSAGEEATAGVTVIESDFEHAQLRGRRFPLVFAAQAWHWVSQPLGYRLAREALEDGGHLVVFWNRPLWEECPLRRDLNEVYEAHVPAELRGGPLHPAPGEASVFSGQDWEQEIAPVDGYAEPEVRAYEWEIDYTSRAYAAMLETISEVRLLDPPVRDRFLEAVRETIDAHGGDFTLAMQTRTCIARATARSTDPAPAA